MRLSELIGARIKKNSSTAYNYFQDKLGKRVIEPDTLLKWYSAYRDIWLVQSIGFPLSLPMTCYLMRVSMLVGGRTLKDLFNCLLYHYLQNKLGGKGYILVF